MANENLKNKKPSKSVTKTEITGLDKMQKIHPVVPMSSLSQQTA